MIQQYRRIKSQIPPDALLLFRLGDFYEMFFEDAKIGARLLNLTLTQRNGMPMCGIPYHAAESYIGRLLRAGRKVAICDQLETPKPGKLVARDITQILSPGTHFDAHLLQASQPNWLAALTRDANRYGLALVDLTTGTFRVTELESEEACRNELQRLRPAEILAPQTTLESLKPLAPDTTWTGYEDWTFEPETAYYTLCDHFKTQSLDGFGAGELTAGIGAAGAALHYLQNALRRDVGHLHRLQVYRVTDYLVLDATTQRNLELVESARGDRRHSLLGCLDHTVTPMGARMLRDWVLHPLQDLGAIRARQDVIAFLIEQPQLLAELREKLDPVRDLERTLSRLSVGTGNARDLVALREALAAVPAVRAVCQPGTPLWRNEPIRRPALLDELLSRLHDLPELVDVLRRALQPAPPLSLKEGGLIQPGYHPQLDELRRAATEGKDWIAALQKKEIERTGIASLKIRYNSVFGYFIEVTRANLDKVPPDYIRKQTIANGERFYTEELKRVEHQILGAEEKANALEYELFLELRQKVVAHSEIIQQTARALATLDALASLADVARLYNYCRPEVNDGPVIEIRDGRHPVLEQTLVGERFVPNDVRLDHEQNQILI
ncbi:MAG: DNA mismatch repair protein MutS, partial [Verrucomicrobiae bacterium]|nr:DNA mismatch repair protein MutS [Verrucomicrobiae bacterium]